MLNDAASRIIRIKRPAECYEAAILTGLRILEDENIIKTDSYFSYLYAKNVINKNNTGSLIRWPEAEDVISKDPTSSVRYAQEIMQKRWYNHLAEKTIAESLIWAPIYCESFNTSLEDLSTNADSEHVSIEALDKSIDILISDCEIFESEEGHFSVANKFEYMTPLQVVLYVDNFNADHDYRPTLIELAKPFVLKSAYASYRFSKDIEGEPWPEGEPVILTNPKATCEYCIQVKGSWPEGEQALLKFQNAECLVDYASNVMEERWREAEDIIKTDPRQALNYAVDPSTSYFWDNPALEREMLKLAEISGFRRAQLSMYAKDLAGFEDLEAFIENNNSLAAGLLKDDDSDLSGLDEE